MAYHYDQYRSMTSHFQPWEDQGASLSSNTLRLLTCDMCAVLMIWEELQETIDLRGIAWVERKTWRK